jgi:hypothetical protein
VLPILAKTFFGGLGKKSAAEKRRWPEMEIIFHTEFYEKQKHQNFPVKIVVPKRS